MKILFVCTGNTCRSPMAEAIARELLEKSGSSAEVCSAGLYVHAGDQTSRLAVQALHDQGIDIQPKKAVQLTPELVSSADVIAVMTQNHAEALLAALPAVKPKLHVLEVEDPYGGSLDEYTECCWALKTAIKHLLRKVKA